MISDKGLPRASAPPLASHRFTARLVSGILALNLIVVLLVALTLYESRKQYEERAAVTAENLSRLLGLDLAASFDKIDLTLLAVVDEVSRLHRSGNLDATALNAFIARQAQRLPELSNFRIADAQGNLRYGTRLLPHTLVNIADREFFIRLRDHPDAGLVVSKPIKSRSNGKWEIVLGRRLNQPDGSFAGTSVALIEVDKITDKFAALNIGPHGFIVLRDLDLYLVARHTALKDNDELIGGAETSRRFKEQLRITPESGIYEAISPIDHIDRVIFYRKISGYPFYLLVGLSTDDYLYEWWKEVAKNGIFMAIFALVTLGFSWRMLGSWKHLKQNEQKFRTLLESAPDPLVIADANGLIVLVNKQVVALFGYEPEELVGQPVEVLLPQRYHGGHVALRQGYAQAPKVREMGKDRLLWAVTKQGREVPVNVSLSPIQTEQGLMVAAAIRDISERKQAEEAIRSKEHLLSESQRIAHVGSWHFDLAGQLTWSDETYRIYGVSPDTFTLNVESFVKLIHPDDRAAMQAWIADCVADKKPGPLEFRVNRPDGTVHTLNGYGELKYEDGNRARNLIGIVLDVTARKAAEEQIAFLAYHDALTQLPNRRLLLDRLQQALASSVRGGHCGALLFIDLDNFKTLSDTLGHDKGDLLLQQVALRLATCVREGDTVARLGGDEFLVMLEDLRDDPKEAGMQAETVGRKILSTLSQPYMLAGHAYHCTTSIGITLFCDHQASLDELLKQADLAMYQSKAAGRNALHFFDPEMQVIVTERAALETDLREAVRQQQFILYYQAQVVGDGRLAGAEALVRWKHPQRGMVSPADFIPLAEETIDPAR